MGEFGDAMRKFAVGGGKMTGDVFDQWYDQKAELDRLRAEMETWKKTARAAADLAKEADDECHRLRAENKRLREALGAMSVNEARELFPPQETKG